MRSRPNTGTWEAWPTLTIPNVALPAGTHVLELRMLTNGATGLTGNFNWLEVR